MAEPPTGLKARFVARLSERLARIAEIEGLVTDETREEVRHLAHALSGSSATYGFPLLGDRARALENGLADGRPPAEVAPLLEALLVEGERVLSSQPS